MAFQFIIDTDQQHAVEDLLHDLWEEIEVFEVDEKRTGVSIPTKILDREGEEKVHEMVGTIRHYDMWKGKWSELEH